ncbi:hypothetical protein HJG54_06980 [Leptolyngbya sp. NK1-12]|uniref:Uncharacterized protein n=1 Tax=Leptolyngbya sp. NK1-12 TaxID=2547451 RepID=A0AA96WHY5_9CYAN|nr:hypothetical protein [Leptolyngbya sp. NK1-12]WNZ22626.1 hypothetical protein HJG54_06980 [Leptolyngbya sp. NK1-12]
MTSDSRPNINISGGTFKDFVAGNKQIKVEGDYIETQNNYTLSPEDQAAIDDLKQVIHDLQARYPTTDPARQSAIIEAEFQEIKQKQPWRWKNLLKAKNLLNGGKIALTKAGEHLFEENIWGKAAIGFLEGVTEEVE